MTNPFPGFNPYLELPAYWPDFHATFINYWREAIADELPDGYEASIGERVYLIEYEPEARKLVSPDVTVSSTRESWVPSTSPKDTLLPVTVPLAVLDGPRETYIEILHRPDQTVVTTLELLSPLPGRTEYLAKRAALHCQPVHLVELDLLRTGREFHLQSRYR
jgi:hypothetical protein